MRLIWLFSLLLLGARLVEGADRATVVTNSVLVQNHGTLTWFAPAGWEYTPPQADILGTMPASFRLRAPDGQPSLMVTVFWDGFGPKKLNPSDAELADLLKKGAEVKFAPGSVEKEVRFTPLAGDRMRGNFVSFTDAKFADTDLRDIPPGEARNATIGMFRTGNLWGNFTLLSTAKEGEQFDQALAVVKSFSGTPVGKGPGPASPK